MKRLSHFLHWLAYRIDQFAPSLDPPPPASDYVQFIESLRAEKESEESARLRVDIARTKIRRIK